MQPESQESNPHEPDDLSPSIHLIIEMYADLNELSRRIGFEVTVTISKVPRKHFENIMDYNDGFFDGHLVADDPLRPLWVKRFVPSVAIYTRQPPEETTGAVRPTQPVDDDGRSDQPDAENAAQKAPEGRSEEPAPCATSPIEQK